VDLRLLLDAEPTPEERDAVDAFLGPSAEWTAPEAAGNGHAAHGGHAARAQRHLLLPTLHVLHARAGWISPGGLNYVAKRLTVPPADVYGVITFYGLFSPDPRPPRVVHVCDDIACRCAGSEALIAELGPEGEAVDGATWLRSPCLGQCDRAPAALLTEAGETPVERELTEIDAALVRGILAGATPPPPPSAVPPQAGDPALQLLGRIGQVDPESLDDYRAHGGYAALRRAFALGPEGVIREVSDSGIVGRGGAAFPMGRKWEAVARHPRRPHYLICNADESEPGTFKDRVLMESDPFALVESVAIAGLATGSRKAFVYIRAEYPLAHQRVQAAIDAAAPYLDGFEIELRIGAGAYVCGEETALFQSIEGKRGEPRNKPPFPVAVGLFGKPTAVNNVETLFNVLEVLRLGGKAYAETGTEGSAGTRLFCVSGAVERPGLYELPFGATLRELLDLAGAAPPKAVLLGGAAGAFVGPDQLDLRLTHEDTRTAGATLGSGVVIVYDEGADLVGALLRIAEFFRDESCGQCVPCRVGTVRQEEALHRLRAGSPHDDELATLAELAQVMRDASICGLGQTAANAVQSAIANLRVFAA
jgi:NADH-quinone oxidoreductase subunit F